MSADHKQWADASAAVPQRDILTTLEACADDPMWSAHAEVSKRTLLAAVSHIRAIRASLARVREALSLSPFDAVERAMSLASLMGGSIGMSNVEKTEAYKRQLRDHLIAYMYPPPEPAPTAPLPAAEEVRQELAHAIKASIKELANGENYPDLMDAVDQLAALATLPPGEPKP